ncbi:MAG TPA: hypothetical protein V6D33_08575, partial [Cyanophyceae cyanobacterium]
MREYLIQGLLYKAKQLAEPAPNGQKCPPFVNSDNPESDNQSFNYQPVEAGFRIEVWDKDNRYDDRLGTGTTTALGGYYEIRFTDEVLRQESGERETLSEAEVFFKVFRSSNLLFSTRGEFLDLSAIDQNPEPTGQTFSLKSYPAQDGFCYQILIVRVSVNTVSESEEREPVTITLPEDKVVDVLPTSDQIVGLGRYHSVAVPDSTGTGGSLKQVVDNAVSQVLGQNFQTSGTTTLRNLLNQVFTPQESNGNKTYIWNPRSYTTQTELGGAITGAQASLYHRAKAALKEILPLLDGLYDLNSSSDKQNREAVRSIVRTEVIELVNEMGVEQGPRVQRVDSLFQLLIGSESESRLPEQIGGQLKDLASAFGLQRSRINTVDEERNYGNFLIIRDYIVSLRQSWQDYRSIQVGGGGAFVGTQLVLLSQALSVMAESVRETYRIMDLVFLGPEERQSVWIDFTLARAKEMPSGIAFPLPDRTGYSIEDTLKLEPSMDLERLLSWAMRFATEEGPILAKSGGKLGIANAIAQTAEKLMILLQAASYVPVGNTAFRRAGAVRALRDLAFQTYQVKRLAQELIPPSISDQPDDVGDRLSGAQLIPPGLPEGSSGRAINEIFLRRFI